MKRENEIGFVVRRLSNLIKRDVEKSKVLSGYIRNSGYQGYYRIVPHTLEEKKTYAPTCEKDGYTEFKCKDCRYVEERNIVDLLGHSYGEDGVCATCGNEKPEEDVNNNNNNNSGNNSSGGSTGYNRIVCTHTAYLDLDVSESSFGVNSGYLEINIANPEVLSGWDCQSTKPQIIKIDNAVLDGEVLKVYYTVMGHGEADILVDLVSGLLDDERRCEIHVVISDK